MDDLVSKLSEIRSQYNCFDEAEEPYYRALSEAIKKLSERADGDTISRRAAIDAECEVCQIAPKKERGHNCTYYVHGCKEIECLRALPSAQPERRPGRWIPQDHNKVNGMASTLVYYYPKCSVCGHCANYTNFCPACGVDMRGAK